MDLITPEFSLEFHGKDLVFAYFIQFARFEYAMKLTGYIKKDPQDNALPDWDVLFDNIEIVNLIENPQTEALKEAIEYYLHNPPAKQVIVMERLGFEDRPLPESETKAKKVSLYIRRVRNNLFHGGKFGVGGGLRNPEKDIPLIKNGLIILNSCLIPAGLDAHYQWGTG